MRSHRYIADVITIFLIVLTTAAVPAQAEDPEEAINLHRQYNQLLSRYVRDLGVDYAAWTADEDDVDALGQYVDALTALDPAGWSREHGLTYWINLYNAVTLRLILDNYPLESIKDLGGFLKTSPWKRHLVTVAGRKLTLNDIENEIIRPLFQEPRIHFALNCASVSCPPLQPEAYRPDSLDEQLDAACKRALNNVRWVSVEEDRVRLTKIFDWYEDDFTAAGDSVIAFINRFREEIKLPENLRISYLPYDWSLNEAHKKATCY